MFLLTILAHSVYHASNAPVPGVFISAEEARRNGPHACPVAGPIRQAVQAGKGELVTALMIAEAAALNERDEAEAAKRRHNSNRPRRGQC